MATILEEKKIRAIVKESVKEAMNTEFMKLGAFLSPYISKEEQKDIERRYGKPSRKSSSTHKFLV